MEKVDRIAKAATATAFCSGGQSRAAIAGFAPKHSDDSKLSSLRNPPIGEKVTILGFGTFERRHRSMRQARYLRTGQPMPFPAIDVPAFKAGQGFSEVVSGKRKPVTSSHEVRADAEDEGHRPQAGGAEKGCT